MARAYSENGRSENALADVRSQCDHSGVFGLLLSIGLAVMSLEQAPIDPQRLAEEETRDADLVREFAKNGDVAETKRPISAYFLVQRDKLAQIKREVVAAGWRVVSASAPDKQGVIYLNIERVQALTPGDLAQLRNDALKIESYFQADYDGWEASVEARED